MSKQFFCSKCHFRLTAQMVGLKKFSQVINTIDPHTCVEPPIDFSKYFNEVAHTQYVDKEFVQKSNELPRASLGSISTDTLRDRRNPENIKSSAPAEITNSLRSLVNSSPAHELKEDDKDG